MAGVRNPDRKPIRGIRRLLLAAGVSQPTLERAPVGATADGGARAGTIVHEQELSNALDPRVAVGEIVALVQPHRLLAQRGLHERVRRIALVAELRGVDGDAPAAMLPVGREGVIDGPLEPPEVGERDPVGVGHGHVRRLIERIRVIGQAGAPKQTRVAGLEGRAAPRRWAADLTCRPPGERARTGIEAVELLHERDRIDVATRRQLADQDRVRSVAGDRERVVRRVDQMPVHRRGGVELAVTVDGGPLRVQPAGLVGLVPDPPKVDLRDRRCRIGRGGEHAGHGDRQVGHRMRAILRRVRNVGPAVAARHGLDELAEVRRRRGLRRRVALHRRALPDRPCRGRRDDLEVDLEADRARVGDDPVPARPGARGVRGRVCGVERRLVRGGRSGATSDHTTETFTRSTPRALISDSARATWLASE